MAVAHGFASVVVAAQGSLVVAAVGVATVVVAAVVVGVVVADVVVVVVVVASTWGVFWPSMHPELTAPSPSKSIVK